MRYAMKGKNIEIGDRTKGKITDKLERIEKFFPEDALASVVLNSEKVGFTVEITIPINKRLIRAEVSDADMMTALDRAVDILEGQIVRYKKRLRSRVRQNADAFMPEYTSVPVKEDELDDEPMFKIAKIKHFEVKPMDAEEAVMEMELIGHSFFVFRNGETDDVNVVYKRTDGSYGLIEPEY